MASLCVLLHTACYASCSLVSNLDFKVTDEDIKELFGTVGPIKESAINYDKRWVCVAAAPIWYQHQLQCSHWYMQYPGTLLLT